MKLWDRLTGKPAEPETPPLPLPAEPPPPTSREQAAADAEARKVQARADRLQTPGPVARLEKEYPADLLKTEGPKPGAQPKDLPERVATQLTPGPGPIAKPDVQEPGQETKWTSQPTPGGSKMVPVRPPYEQAKDAADNADRSTPGGDDVEGR